MTLTPIYDELVTELGDPHEFAAHTPTVWESWTFVYDLAAAPVTRAKGRPKTPKRRSR